jgi:glycosyltransferase involved in cell wall biosynthesis
MKKIAIVVTHPIQYYVPLFQALAQDFNLMVFYTWGIAGIGEKFDPDFKRKITWDLPLLEGYSYKVVENIASNPGSDHFRGIINPNLIAQINSFNPDKLLIYGWSYHSHLQVIRYFKNKIPIYFRGDSNLLDHKGLVKRALRFLFLKWIYNHIDKALYVGKANRTYYEHFGLNQKQLIFVPHAIDNVRFSNDRSIESNKLRESLGIHLEEILILFAGKLESKKNPEILLKTFLKSKSNLHLLFVGNGALEESLKSKVKQSVSRGISISEQVHFMDFQNQTHMPMIYQACDIFCLPSRGPGETWGLAVNEAMASGKAILVTNKVGCNLDLVDESNGFIFDSEDENSLFNILLSLEKMDLMGKGSASREKIKKYSYHVSLEVLKAEFNMKQI